MQNLFSKEPSSPPQEELFVRSNKASDMDKKEDSLLVLSKVLTWIGIGESDTENCKLSRKCLKHVFPFTLVVFALDMSIMFVFHFLYLNSLNALANVAYLVICLLSPPMWYTLYKRNQLLSSLFSTLSNVSKTYSKCDCPKPYILKLFLFVYLTLIILCSISITLDMDGTANFCRLFSYYQWDQYDDIFWRKLYVSLKTLCMSICSSLFNNIVAFVYCCLCIRCSALLVAYRKEMEKIRSANAHDLLEPKLGKDYLELMETIEEVQSVFSHPSFFAFLTSFMQAFQLLSRFLTNPSEELKLLFMLEHVGVHIPAAVFTFVIPICAAQIAKESEKNRAMFERLYERLIFHGQPVSDEHLQVIQTLKQIRPISFSAWEMFEFTPSMVPTVLGTFLTYGLLLLSATK